jgi:predicted ATPase
MMQTDGGITMSTAITTVVKMLEALPGTTQEQVVEHLREYIAELKDEAEWDAQFERTQEQLVAAARKVKAETATGGATPMNDARL